MQRNILREDRVNCARRFKEGWIWFDQWGKDYGPYPTKNHAITLGQEHAAKEEKLLRTVSGCMSVCQMYGGY